MNDEKQGSSEWRNEKAILMQKLQIQEMYIIEAKQREENLRKMNDAFMKTVSMPQSENITLKIQKTYEQEQIAKQQDTIRSLEVDIKCMEDKLREKDNQLQNNIKSYEEELLRLQEKLVDSEAQRGVLERKLSDQKYKIKQVENVAGLESQLREAQNQLQGQKIKLTQELEKQKQNYELQIRRLRNSSLQNSQKQNKENEDSNKVKDENKKLKIQMKSQENTVKLLRSKLQENDQNYVKELESENTIIKEQNIELQQKHTQLSGQYDALKNQLVQLSSQLEEEKVSQQRQRHQSPSHPTTRIRTNLQQTYEESQQLSMVDVDVSNFMSKMNGMNSKPYQSIDLENQMRQMQQRLYHAKKRITTNTVEESSFIRQSIQKIRNRSRNHSTSMNDNGTMILDDSKLNHFDDSVEYRTHSSYQDRRYV